MNLDNNDECPICLVHRPLITTPCKHHACQNCLERVLLVTQQSLPSSSRLGEESVSTEEELEDAIVSSNPTCGRCPFCRKCISLFDLKFDSGRDKEEKFIYKRRYDVWRTALSGISFQDEMRSIILNFSSIDESQPNIILSVDPNRDLNISFEKGCFFHEKTKTFHGMIDLSKGDQTRIQEKWEFVMQFASDFRFVIHGAIIKRPVEIISDEPSNHQTTAYPLDGVWVVRCQRSDQRGVDRNSLDAARLIVYGNSFQFHGFTYHINLGDDNEERVHFSWPSYLGSYKQVAESGIDLRFNPHGPDVGETIVWNTSNPHFFRIFWTRETKENTLPPIRVQRLGAGGTKFVKLQQRRHVEMPVYHSDTLWGNVFVQGMTVGYASYHFVSPDGDGENGAYISYEHIKCSYWPPLDDGSPVPSRVPFVNISYEPATRTFRGQIPWYDRYGTSWQGCTSWEYEMTFDSEFLCIVHGEVKNIRTPTNPQPSEVYSYGLDLNYINCALPQKVHGESSEDNRFIMRMRERLLEENASQRTLVLLMQAIISVLDHNRDIFDYNN